MKKKVILVPLVLVFCLFCFGFYNKMAAQWKAVTPANLPLPRHENAFARVGDAFFLLGGRQVKPVERYDIKTNRWEKRAAPPLEMSHFQAVTFKDEIYVVGAFTGGYPHETPIPRIYIYNPKQDAWREGPEIPADRRRGSAGVTVYQNKIYVVCGITDGHWDGQVSWFDEYNPATNTWRKLPDAPRTRDHVSIAVADNQLVVAGGRRSTARVDSVLNTTIAQVDVYDFKTNKWRTAPAAQNIPTERAGCTAVPLGSKVIIIGGESPQKVSHNETEAFDVKTNTWQKLAPMQTGRHGTQAVIYQNKVFIAAGSGNHGGGPELNSMEVME
jgi:N-acetylneuraminic acid mutarotase